MNENDGENSLDSAFKAAEKFVSDNLVELCKECIEFDSTSILPNGKLRVLISLVEYSGASAQRLAISMVERKAVAIIAGKI